MKKYFLGLLLLLAFIQPLVVNVLVYNAHGYLFHGLTIKSPVKKAPASKSLGVDSVIIDFDDDEVNEEENKDSSTDLYCQYNMNDASFYAHSPLTTLKGTALQFKHINKPLYILWSVFRI